MKEPNLNMITFQNFVTNYYLDIETNKNKSARLNFNKLNFKYNKTNFLIEFLKLDKTNILKIVFVENFIN